MYKAILVLCLSNSALFRNEINAEIEDRFKEDYYKIYKNIAFETRNLTYESVTPDKIKYFLFTKRNPTEYTEIDPENPEELDNRKAPIVFFIHGWTENRRKEWYEDLKNAFLNRSKEYYVVQVDWSDPADQLYTVSSWNTKDVGHIIGEFIVGLRNNYSIPLQNFLIVGHSLGGQVSGFVGKKVRELTSKKLPRLIALDPAGPLFEGRPDTERLNENDAKVVEVIHTSGGTAGFKSPIGTIDFFPNGGSSQPGCPKVKLIDVTSVTDSISCAHHRSFKYFIEAVSNPEEFIATKCSDWKKFQENSCKKNKVAMGDLETRQTGNFYLKTNSKEPFGK